MRHMSLWVDGDSDQAQFFQKLDPGTEQPLRHPFLRSDGIEEGNHRPTWDCMNVVQQKVFDDI